MKHQNLSCQQNHKLRTSRHYGFASLAIAAFSAVTSISYSTQANTFAPVCTPIEVPVKISTKTGSSIMAQSLDTPGYLANNLNHPIWLGANHLVKDMTFVFSEFRLDENLDHVIISNNGTTLRDLTGYLTPEPGGPYPSNYETTVTVPTWARSTAQLRLVTDPNYPGGHYSLDSVRVTCKSTGTPAAQPMNIGQEYVGVLLGTNDTIYYSRSAVSGAFTNLSLWTDLQQTNPDFDIFARCNAWPTPTQYDYTAQSSDSMEFLSLNNSNCQNGTWYIAINSYSGAGTYHLSAGIMYPSAQVHVYASVNRVRTTQEMNTFANDLLGAAKLVYGMTEGAYIIHTHFCQYQSCPQSPTVIFRDDCDRSYATGTGQVNLCPAANWAGYRTIAHEYGHALLGLADEYQDVADGYSKAQCGHTIMGDGYTTAMNSICAGKSATGFSEHGKDPQSGTSAMAYPMSEDWNTGWYRLANQSFIFDYMQMMETSSNYSYYNHDFNGFLDIEKLY